MYSLTSGEPYWWLDPRCKTDPTYMRVAAVARAFPPHLYSQEEMLVEVRRMWGGRVANPARIESLFRNVLVGSRYLSLPLEEYGEAMTFGDKNDAWIRVAEEVGSQAISEALVRAGLSVADVDALIFVSVTGVSTPSLDARLINRLGLPAAVRRTPIFGLGCVAGAAGIARAADYLRGHPEHVAVLLSVELCSLTLQRQDLSVSNIIASGLFGDGAAAAVLVGSERESASSGGPEIIDSRSVFYPDTEEVMGWKVSERGFEIILSARIPQMVRDHLRGDVDTFLADHGLSRSDIATWVAHPGGPRVLEAMAEALELEEGALALTWRTLEKVGNLSSTSVLLVLEDTIEQRPEAGSLGLLLAMGPGFCTELVLLRW